VFEITTGSSWSQFETCLKELSPYVKERLTEITSLSMPKLERCLKESYNENERFKKLIDEVFEEYWNKVVPINKRIAKKILDYDLWFLINYRLHDMGKKTTISRKFTGRLLELVVESVLKAYLNEKLDYDFIDHDPVDYVIIDNDTTVCEISCKTVLSTTNQYYDHAEHATQVADRLEGQTKKFVVFCATAYLEQKDEIRKRFVGIDNCELFYLWDRIGRLKSSAYILNGSFYGFIDFIKNLM
jgi:hypothetical protein